MKISNQIKIQASPSLVWKVTEDLEKWPEWSPTFERVEKLYEGTFQIGSKARIKQPKMSPAVWVVTSMEYGKSYRWETTVNGIKMIASHELIQDADGTINILQLEMSGLVSLVLGPLIRSQITKALKLENEGLKKVCETLSA